MTEETVCPGRENDPWRKTRVAYAQAMQAWEQAVVAWEATPVDERDEDPPTRPEPPDYPDTTAGDPIWCGRCTAGIRRKLGELDDLAALAAATADGMRATGDSDKVTGTPGTASPSPTQDTIDALYRDLVDLEDWHRETMGYDRRPNRGDADARTLSLTIAWLAQHITGILTRSNAEEAGKTILRWHSQLQARTRSEPEPNRRPVRCPRCKMLALRKRDDGYIGCEECGRLLSDDDYDQLAEQQASKQQEQTEPSEEAS